MHKHELFILPLDITICSVITFQTNSKLVH